MDHKKKKHKSTKKNLEYRSQLNIPHANKSDALHDESKDEIKRQANYETIEKAADPEGLWQLVEETHKINSISKVEAINNVAKYFFISAGEGDCFLYTLFAFPIPMLQ